MSYNHSNDSMNLGTSGSTKVTVTSSGNLGIGTASPSEKLSVKGTGSQYILVQSDDNSGSGIYFGNTGSNDRRITLDSSSLLFENFNGSAEYMRIDSGGNLLVGKTATSVTTLGIEARANGLFAANKSGGASGYFGRHVSDGNIVEFRKDSTTVGSIG